MACEPIRYLEVYTGTFSEKESMLKMKLFVFVNNFKKHYKTNNSIVFDGMFIKTSINIIFSLIYFN